jgi:plastocyanin
MELLKDTVLIGPGERYDLELLGDNPGVWMFHCHMEAHAANGMMSLIEYEGEVPTGPAAEFFSPGGGVPGMHAGHSEPSTGTTDPAAHAHAGREPVMVAAGGEPSVSAPATAPDEPDAPPADGPALEVALLDDRFDPKVFEATVGTKLTFVNKGNHVHSIAAFDGSFNSGNLKPGESYSVVLDKPGVIKLICRQHGLRGMSGQVTVR